MKKKKVLAFIAAAAVFVLLIAGCAQQEEKKTTETPPSPEKQGKEYSLQEILNESQGKLSEAEYTGLFGSDVFLSELSLRKDTKVVEGDTVPPAVSIINPKKNEVISQTKTITVFALDNAGVSKIEFFIDGEKIGSRSQLPFNYAWDTLSKSQAYANGTHTVKVVAYDAAGNTAEDSHNVKVQNIQRLTISKYGSQFAYASGNVVARNRSYDKDDDTYFNIAHLGSYNSTATVIYEFQPPNPNCYLYLDYSAIVKDIAGEEALYSYYDWALNEWVYFIDNADTSELQFWACEPYYNHVLIRVEVLPWSIAEVREVTLGYRYLPDGDTPTLSNIDTLYNTPISSGGTGMWTNFVFLTNEDVFITVEVRRPDGTFVQNVTAAWRNHATWTPTDLEDWADLPHWADGTQIAPPPGWDYGFCFVPWNQLDSAGNLVHGAFQYRITVKDTAGHSRTSSWYDFSLP